MVVTNGRRECIDRSVDAALANLHGLPWERILICDDSGDSAYRDWLRQRFPSDLVTVTGEGEALGFAPAIRRALDAACSIRAEHIFWLEDDFIVQRPVDLAAMADTLDARSYLSQMLLKRQPWFSNEVAAGGIIEADPHRFTQCGNDEGDRWVEHDAYWCNPHLAKTAFLREHRWPAGEWSESKFGALLRSEGWRGGIWGELTTPPYVEHVGIRSGFGY